MILLWFLLRKIPTQHSSVFFEIAGEREGDFILILFLKIEFSFLIF